MSETVATGAICPGQRALFANEGDAHYLRVAFMTYWIGGNPSVEIFYLTGHPLQLNPAAIVELETEVVALLKAHDTSSEVAGAVYLSYTGIEMSDADVATAGWRVISGSAG